MSQSKESFRSFSYEKEVERAKWLKEDLDKGNGWREVQSGPGVAYWLKVFPEENVPIKLLFTFEMPMPAKTFLQMLLPPNREIREKWDEVFKGHETLEVYPDDGGYVTYMQALFPQPLADRDFVLFIPPIKEIDWYGKQSLFLIQKHGWHPSKPENEGGIVRATNGGNFFIAAPDDEKPEAACKVFGLTTNTYNGWLPSWNAFMTRLLSRAIPTSFNKLRDNMITGYIKYFQGQESGQHLDSVKSV